MKSRDELIKIAKTKPEVPFDRDKKTDLDYMRAFISDTNILPHDKIRIPAYVIYMKYYHWCKITGNKLRSSRDFFSQFKHFFNRKQTSKMTYYLMNPVGWDLSFESNNYAKEEFKKLSPLKNQKKR